MAIEIFAVFNSCKSSCRLLLRLLIHRPCPSVFILFIVKFLRFGGRGDLSFFWIASSQIATTRFWTFGGYWWFWVSQPPIGKQLDTLNVHPVSYHAENFPKHPIRVLIGDGCKLNMPDKNYDIGFSNSVIEHVGSWERQQQFAAEIRRATNALWVQTPAYGCPIEPHYLTPFIHYMPKWFQKKILRRCTLWGWIQRPSREEINSMVETARLLRKSEMLQLFPDCKILTERLLWVIPKSYIAFRPKTPLSIYDSQSVHQTSADTSKNLEQFSIHRTDNT